MAQNKPRKLERGPWVARRCRRASERPDVAQNKPKKGQESPETQEGQGRGGREGMQSQTSHKLVTN